ncbi:MAG: hypothetical protein FVQ85_21595 [Planctomycetes bacterium]|nr:hypothetical protein [Planctomycetota bacterium]
MKQKELIVKLWKPELELLPNLKAISLIFAEDVQFHQRVALPAAAISIIIYAIIIFLYLKQQHITKL